MGFCVVLLLLVTFSPFPGSRFFSRPLCLLATAADVLFCCSNPQSLPSLDSCLCFFLVIITPCPVMQCPSCTDACPPTSHLPTNFVPPARPPCPTSPPTMFRPQIRKLFNLTKEDDVRKYVNTYRKTKEKDGKKHSSAPKIQR